MSDFLTNLNLSADDLRNAPVQAGVEQAMEAAAKTPQIVEAPAAPAPAPVSMDRQKEIAKLEKELEMHHAELAKEAEAKKLQDLKPKDEKDFLKRFIALEEKVDRLYTHIFWSE